ncbi:MAG: hypothetical protein QME81_09305 [bacterium]|nr:hypothetical protein [bacterium]
MAQDQKRRQKALLKKKQKAKQRQKAKQGSHSFTGFFGGGDGGYSIRRNYIKNARKYPVYECLINSDWQRETEHGLVRILLSREQPNGNIVFATYLVDIYCLGLKNTFYNADFTLSRYKTELKSQFFPDCTPIDCHPQLANKIILGAIEYARKLGFKPNKDFQAAKYLLEETSEAMEEFDVTFGKDGKPFYIAGPHDNQQKIIRTLMERLGPGNFHYFVPVPMEEGY